MFWTHRSFWILPILVASILGGFAAIVSHSRLRKVYERRFPESRRERLFLASFGFFTTALVVRAITIAIHHDIGPFHDVSMKGRHIHHLVWGILLLLLVGYAWLIARHFARRSLYRSFHKRYSDHLPSVFISEWLSYLLDQVAVFKTPSIRADP
jgi:hypothetical protein